MDKNLFFLNGRSALMAGLMLLKLQKNDEVLIPQFICDSVLYPFKDLKIKTNFYKIKENLKPDWVDINKKYSKKTKAIMMIHYFGFPTETKKFLNFKKKNKIYLIEDYCHGFSGKKNEIELGDVGDFSFSSLKKIFPDTISGGILKINNKNIANTNLIGNFKKYKNFKLFFEIFRKIKNIKTKIEKTQFFLSKNSKYASYQSSTLINKKNYFYGDLESFKFLSKKNFVNEKKKRFIKYKKIEKLLKQEKIYPLFDLKDNSLLPWYFVAKVKENKRKYIFRKLSKIGLKVFSWPNFPRELEKNKLNIKLWNSIICVNLI